MFGCSEQNPHSLPEDVPSIVFDATRTLPPAQVLTLYNLTHS